MPSRALVSLALGVGYPLAAWLRFDRGAYHGSVGAILASLALIGAAAWITAEELRKARIAARKEDLRAGLRPPALESEWQEFARRVRAHAATELEETVRRGPLRNGVSIFPVSFVWLGTLGLLFAPVTVVPDLIPIGARGLSAVSVLMLAAGLASLALGYTGWRQARAKLRRAATLSKHGST